MDPRRGLRAARAVDMDRRIARIVRRRPRRLWARDALATGPRVELRPGHRDVLIGEQPCRAGLRDDGIEERARDIARQQALPFLLNVVGDPIGASIPRPTNQRYSTRSSISALSHRSLRTGSSAGRSHARRNGSGGLDGRPIAESIAANRGDSVATASSVRRRIARSGGAARTRGSGERSLNLALVCSPGTHRCSS